MKHNSHVTRVCYNGQALALRDSIIMESFFHPAITSQPFTLAEPVSTPVPTPASIPISNNIISFDRTQPGRTKGDYRLFSIP